jgi:4-amino-4-deoxy-L-arabinose transferase-like glycosyltransferase
MRLPRSFGGRLALIAAVGLALRVAYTLAIARSTPGIGDFFYYHWIANLIADGRGYVDPFDATIRGQYNASAGHPPLWPALLSLVSELGGRSLEAHRLTGCVAGTGTVILIGLLGRRIGGDRIGLVAAVLAAGYPILIGADGSLLAESLYGLLIAAALLAAYRLYERPTAWNAALLGAVIALSALTRSEGLGLLALLALPLAWRGGGTPAARALRVAAPVVAAALVLAPWTIRNWSVFDRFVLISVNDSTVLAGANCDRAYYGADVGNWRFDCISPKTRRNEAAQAAVWRREGLEYARDHLGRLAVVIPVRVLRTFDLYQPRRQVLFAEGRHVRMEQAGVATYFLLLPLAAIGALVLRRRRQRLWILLAPFVLVLVTCVIGYGIPRLRHSAEIPLLVLASVGIAELADRRRRGELPSWLPARLRERRLPA